MGTVEIATDGIWTYTSGPDFAYGVPESFTVAVTTGGFNILNPRRRPTRSESAGRVVNHLGRRILRPERHHATVDLGRKLPSVAATANGDQLQPGEQVELDYTTDSPWLGDTTFELRASSSSAGVDVWHAIEEGVTPGTPSGSLSLQGFECGSSGGNAGCVESSSDWRRLLLGDAADVYGYTKDISGAEDALAKLTQMADNYVDVLTVRWIKTQFLDRGEVLSH